jgi:hypothetical protein
MKLVSERIGLMGSPRENWGATGDGALTGD